MKHLFNEIGGSKIKITAIIIILLLLIGGGLAIYNDIADKNVSFTDEEIATATKLAQDELNSAFAATEEYPFDRRIEGIQSIGYSEPKIEKSMMTFEKHNESDVYILLKLQPHESYDNLTRVLVQIFDKEKGSLITELDNVLTWKEN